MIPRPLRIALLAVLAAWTLSGCGGAFRPAAAVVDGRKISDDRLEAVVPAYRFLAGLQGISCGTPQQGERKGSACVRFTLTNLVQQELVRGFARDNHIRVTALDVREALGQLAASLGGQQELATRLAGAGLSLSDLEDIGRGLILFQRVAQQVTAGAADPSETFRRWLSDRLCEADVKINPRYGRVDVERIQVVPITSTATTGP